MAPKPRPTARKQPPPPPRGSVSVPPRSSPGGPSGTSIARLTAGAVSMSWRVLPPINLGPPTATSVSPMNTGVRPMNVQMLIFDEYATPARSSSLQSTRSLPVSPGSYMPAISAGMDFKSIFDTISTCDPARTRCPPNGTGRRSRRNSDHKVPSVVTASTEPSLRGKMDTPTIFFLQPRIIVRAGDGYNRRAHLRPNQYERGRE